MMKRMQCYILVVVGLAVFQITSVAQANGQCPQIGSSPSCSLLITITPNGSLTFKSDPLVPPFDGIEDVLVGVFNNSGANVFGVSLIGNGIFGFDGDGAGTLFGSAGATGYEGPNTSFTIIDDNSGTVNFTATDAKGIPIGLPNQQFIWFSLEGSPDAIALSQRVTIDPGHGLTCPTKADKATKSSRIGVVGITNFTTPPLGLLHEDLLTVAVATSLNTILQGQHFIVNMTKADTQSCPTLLERANIANNFRSNLYISVHFNAPNHNPLSQFFDSGPEILINPSKSSSRTLASLMLASLSSSIGLSPDIFGVRSEGDDVVLTETRMTAVIAEVAHLSPPDDGLIHDDPDFVKKAAKGIADGINAFINQ